MKLTEQELEMIYECADELIERGDAWLNTSNSVEYKEARGDQPETDLMVKLAIERGITEDNPDFEELDQEFMGLFDEAMSRALKNKLQEQE